MAFTSTEHFAKTDWRGRQVEEKKRVGRVTPKGKPMRWVSLHGHSTFSYLDAIGLPKNHAERAAELQICAMALTEHGSVSSHVKLEQAARAAGIKPIYGCEFYMSPGKTQRKNHLTVLAEDQEGYRNLLRLVTYSWEHHHYEPTVHPDVLFGASGGLVVLSGCLGSELATSLIGGKLVDESRASYRLGRKVAARYRRALGDRYYLEVQAFPELADTRRVNGMISRLSTELKIPIVASMDTHYTRPEESVLQQILHNVRGGGKETLEEQSRRWGYDVPLCPPERDHTIVTRLQATGLTKLQAQAAVLNAEEIAQRCNVVLPKLPMVRFPLPDGYDDRVRYWRDMIREGWRYRKCEDLPRKERERYKAQLQYEAGIIESKDFIDYFLIVGDAVRWAKDNEILVGPARGSAAASLICWLLRITEVNPMLFPDLVFERFIDMTRTDLPDIDLDFTTYRRHEVREYLVSKYGAECVGNIGSYVQYKGKNSLDDVGRAFRVPSWEVQKIKDLLIERSSGDLRASATIMDTVEQFEAAAAVFDNHPNLGYAVELEGNYRGQGVHAAGLVVANGPLTDVCAVLRRKVKDTVTEVVAFDKYDAEYAGLLKMDFLSLNTISMLEEALGWLKLPIKHLETLPLDDPKVLKGFEENDAVGIFQFDGQAARNVNGSLKANTFKEVCDVNALCRPGPLHSGASAEYIDVKWKRKEAEALHPLWDAITSTTHYQVIYQEQILRVMGEVGGFDHTHRTHIRKIISRKLGEQEFNRQWSMFRDGAAENGIEEPLARKMWDKCTTAGSYAFNAAHCVSYGMLAYWTMWLKVYHPVEFYAAALKHLAAEKEARIALCRDAHRRHGVRVLPPHYSRSGASWAPTPRRAVRAGLTQVPGVGEATAGAMLALRKARRVAGWKAYLDVKGIGDKTVDKMEKFAKHPDPFEIFALERKIKGVYEAIKRGELRDPVTGWPLPLPTHKSIDVPFERGPDIDVVWLGSITHRNLRDLFESHRARTGEELDPETIKRPDLREWVVMRAADEEDTLWVTSGRYSYPDMRTDIWDINLERDVVLVSGQKNGYQARRNIYIKRIWVIEPDEEIFE